VHAARLFILGMFPYVAAGLLTMTFGHPRGCVLLAGITAATITLHSHPPGAMLASNNVLGKAIGATTDEG
jgi:hypothetical protein